MFSGYSTFDACVEQNCSKDDPSSYCLALQRRVEGSKIIAHRELQQFLVLDEQDDPSVWLVKLTNASAATLSPSELERLLQIDTGWIAFPDESPVELRDAVVSTIPVTEGRKPAPLAKKWREMGLGRKPTRIEAQLMSLTTLPENLNNAVDDAVDVMDHVYSTIPRGSGLLRVMRSVSDLGVSEVKKEMARQGAELPDNDLYIEIDQLHAHVLEELSSQLSRMRTDVIRSGQRRGIHGEQLASLLTSKEEYFKPGIHKRIAAMAVHESWGVSRAATFQALRSGVFNLASTGIKPNQIDIVMQSAVLDKRTCKPCLNVDGEIMEFGSERQEYLAPPYINCFGGFHCRCTQLAMLADGGIIDVSTVTDTDNIFDDEDLPARGTASSKKVETSVSSKDKGFIDQKRAIDAEKSRLDKEFSGMQRTPDPIGMIINSDRYIKLPSSATFKFKVNRDKIMGLYRNQSRQLYVSTNGPARWAKKDYNGLGKRIVGESPTALFRHELGHHVHNVHRGRLGNEWTNIHKNYVHSRYTEPASANARLVSQYALTNESELFAESYSAYTSARYAGDLPPAIHAFMERNIGVRLASTGKKSVTAIIPRVPPAPRIPKSPKVPGRRMPASATVTEAKTRKMAVMSELDVKQMRLMYDSGDSLNKIRKKFGISWLRVQKILDLDSTAGKAVRLTPSVPTFSPTPNPQWVRTIDRDIASSVSQQARAAGMTIAEFKEEVARHAKALLDDADVYSRVHSDTLIKIIKDGRFKSQFETRTSQGILDTVVRSDLEKNLFGHAKDIPVNQRPIYGYLASDGDGHISKFASVDCYGDIAVKFKPSVRARTTFTVDDSLNRNYDGPGALADPLLSPTHRSLMHKNEGPLSWNSIETPFQRDDVISSYMEAQVHKGLSIDDIAEVIFRKKNARPPIALTQKLDRLGIPWRIVSRS